MDIDIRLAHEDDIETLLKICAEASQTEGSDWDESYPDYNILADGIAKGNLCVIMLDGCPAGIVAVGKNGALDSIPAELAEEGAAEIARFGLCNRAQGKGVAKKILELVCGELKRRGYNKIRLMVYFGFERGIRLYEKSGFVRVRPIRAYDLDFYCYEKTL